MLKVITNSITQNMTNKNIFCNVSIKYLIESPYEVKNTKVVKITGQLFSR